MPKRNPIMISGTVSDWDKWGRFHVLYDDTFHGNGDRLNTRRQLEAYDKRYRNRMGDNYTSPLKPKYYLVKCGKDMLVAKRDKMQVPVEPKAVVGMQVEIEVELCDFTMANTCGWYIRGRILTY